MFQWPYCCWTTHSSRRRHWSMAWSLKHCDILSQSVTFHKVVQQHTGGAVGFLVTAFCKFSPDSDSETISKIGEYLIKLQHTKFVPNFLDHFIYLIHNLHDPISCSFSPCLNPCSLLYVIIKSLVYVLNKKLSRCQDSATCCRSAKLHILYIPPVFLSQIWDPRVCLASCWGRFSWSVVHEQAFCIEVPRGNGNVHSRTSNTMMMMMNLRWRNITIRVGFGSQDTDLSCRADFYFLLHYAITIHQHYRQTERQRDGRTLCS